MNKKNGVVLSGGGGTALIVHLGALKAIIQFLKAEMIGGRIDIGAGTSAGGIVLGKFSLEPNEMGLDKMRQLLFTITKKEIFGCWPEFYVFIQSQIIFRLNPNWVKAFTRHKPYRSFLEGLVGDDTYMSDAMIELALTSTNISTRKSFIYRSDGNGSERLVDGIEATAAEPPGLHPLHTPFGTRIDGGLDFLLPVVQAVDFKPDRMFVVLASKILREHTEHRVKGVLNLVEQALRTKLVQNTEQAIALAVDEDDGIESYILKLDDPPDVGDPFFGFFDHKQELWDYGYETTRDILAKGEPVNINPIMIKKVERAIQNGLL